VNFLLFAESKRAFPNIFLQVFLC